MFADHHREVAALRLLALGTWAFLVVLPNWWDVHLATLLRLSHMLIIRTKTGLFYSPLFDQFLLFFTSKSLPLGSNIPSVFVTNCKIVGVIKTLNFKRLTV